MIKGKTQLGFEFELSVEVLDDWELLEGLRKIDKGDTSLIVDVAEILLGTEQYERLKQFLKEKYGRVQATVMTAAIKEILDCSKETKN